MKMVKGKASEKKKFKVPHSLVIITLVVIFAAIMTWIVPAGTYERVENRLGMEVVDPETFRHVEKQPVNLLEIPKYIIEGYLSAAELVFVVIFAGAAFDVITSSGALQSLIGLITRKFSRKEEIFIPILTLVFGLICTTQAVNRFIGFAPVMVMIARTMGFDSITGVAIILLGGAVGFSTGTLNVNTTLTAQRIAELPLYSGIEYRAFSFVVFYIVSNIYLVRYAKRVRENPELSPMYQIDSTSNMNQESGQEHTGHMTVRDWLVIASLFGTLATMVYGGVKLDWGLKENSVAFIWMGILAGIFAGYNPNRIAKCFVNGGRRMIGAALILGLARAVSGVLKAGLIMDTTIHGLAKILGKMPKYLLGPSMFIANIIINMLITSGSGQAAAVMPILAPLADMIGLTRQTAVLAFNFGDGFCNYILPTSTALMGILSVTNIPYDRWMMFMWKLFLIWIVVGSLLVTGAQIINLGPI